MDRRIVITHWVPAEIVEFLTHCFEVVPNTSCMRLAREEVLRRATSAEAIMVCADDSIDADFLDHCPELRIVAGALRSFGNVDVQACTDRGVWVTAVPDIPGAPITEADEAVRAIALEGAANIFEALLGDRPGGAINAPSVHRRRVLPPTGMPTVSG